jgi:hypothetical protein
VPRHTSLIIGIITLIAKCFTNEKNCLNIQGTPMIFADISRTLMMKQEEEAYGIFA